MEHCCYGPSHTVSPGRLLLTAAGLWTLQPGGGDGDGTIITDTGCPVYKLLLSPCKLLLISDFRSIDHLLVSYPIGLHFTYLDFLVNILKKILYPQNILSGIINEQSWQFADNSISPCCGNVKNCHFSGVLPDGNWKYGKFVALLYNTSALDYSWYCQFLCISSVSVQWDVNIAK